jgi:gas vesicle protein GvpO
MAERKNQRRNGRLSARDAIAHVRRDFPELLGKPIESVLGVEHDDDQGWSVMVQVVELSRVPSTTDVLGCYAVTLDSDGDLVGYRRTRRYNRNQTDQEDS